MTTDFRALCAELLDALDSGFTAGRIRMSPLVNRARAALDEPQPDGPAVPAGREPASVKEDPTDEDIMALMPQQMHEDLAAAARAMAGFDSPKAAMGAIRNILNCHVVDHARAVLARWGE